MLEENSNNNTDLPDRNAFEKELRSQFDSLTDRGVQALLNTWRKYGTLDTISTEQFKEILDKISDVLAEEKKRLNNDCN